MNKKIPQRMCVACREMKDKPQLLRLVRTAEQKLELDLSGKKPGRGAYICAHSECLAQAKKKRALERALNISPEADFWQQLAEVIDQRSTTE